MPRSTSGRPSPVGESLAMPSSVRSTSSELCGRPADHRGRRRRRACRRRRAGPRRAAASGARPRSGRRCTAPRSARARGSRSRADRRGCAGARRRSRPRSRSARAGRSCSGGLPANGLPQAFGVCVGAGDRCARASSTTAPATTREHAIAAARRRGSTGRAAYAGTLEPCEGIAPAPAAFLGLAAEIGATDHREPMRRNVPSYSELLAQAKSEIHELDARALEARLRGLRAAPRDRRPRARRVRAGRDPRLDPHPARAHRVAHRGPRPRPRHADRRQLRVGRALGLRRPRARRARLPQRRVADRRLRRLEVRRPPVERAAPARRRAPRALLAPHPDPRGRRGGPAQAARLEGAAARRRRARLARRAVPRRSRRRHARPRRRRHRRRLEPAAPGAAHDRPDRSAEDGICADRARGAEPRRDASSSTACA